MNIGSESMQRSIMRNLRGSRGYNMPHGVRVQLDAGVVDLRRTARTVVKAYNAGTEKTGSGFVVREYRRVTDSFSTSFSRGVNGLMYSLSISMVTNWTLMSLKH